MNEPERGGGESERTSALPCSVQCRLDKSALGSSNKETTRGDAFLFTLILDA